ncbi:MAG: zinc ABC transporter substrate-binding protein [Candidatus Thiodiazotropha sp.]
MIRFVCALLLILPGLLSAEPLRVFVSVLPIQYFVEQVGGEHVQVQALVRPGHSPHNYDPSPQQIAALSRAQLYLRTGVPFENAWMARIRSTNPAMRVVDLREGIELFPAPVSEHAHEHEHEHEAHEAFDPHIWTDPQRVMHMAGVIRDNLIDLDPGHRADYEQNHHRFVAQLQRLDGQIEALLKPVQHRSFLVYHPSWGYFAHRYGLLQVPIEYEGKEPGARALTALIDQARREDIRVIFVQPQFDRRLATQVARAIDGRVIAVDPLALDYIQNLRHVAEQFAGVLQP